MAYRYKSHSFSSAADGSIYELYKRRISFVCLFPCIVCCCIISAVSLPSAPPIIFVVIGLIIALDEYVVYVRNDAGEILTDSAGNDIISL